MSQFTAQIETALRELREWQQAPDSKDQRGSWTCELIEQALRKAESLADEQALYEHLAGLNRFIGDQGPLSEEFIPSFKSLILSLHKRHS